MVQPKTSGIAGNPLKVVQQLLHYSRKDATYQAGMAFISGDFEQLKSLLNLLHEQERQKLDGFKFDLRKISYLLGRLSAKKALEVINPEAILQDVHIGQGVFQFPVGRFQSGPNFQFCISHCEEIGVALAYPEEHPIGIDIEKINSKSLDALESQFTAEEKQYLSALKLDMLTGLTMLWTAKEALSKIFRTGMMMDFHVFELKNIEWRGNHFVSEYKNCGQYKAISIIRQDYACTMTIPGRSSFDEQLLIDAFERTL
ncbi:MAG: 4'-phosphopantetheinyl transferase superfamily protein [Bacteroidota bacterium]